MAEKKKGDWCQSNWTPISPAGGGFETCGSDNYWCLAPRERLMESNWPRSWV